MLLFSSYIVCLFVPFIWFIHRKSSRNIILLVCFVVKYSEIFIIILTYWLCAIEYLMSDSSYDIVCLNFFPIIQKLCLVFAIVWNIIFMICLCRSLKFVYNSRKCQHRLPTSKSFKNSSIQHANIKVYIHDKSLNEKRISHIIKYLLSM